VLPVLLEDQQELLWLSDLQVDLLPVAVALIQQLVVAPQFTKMVIEILGLEAMHAVVVLLKDLKVLLWVEEVHVQQQVVVLLHLRRLISCYL